MFGTPNMSLYLLRYTIGTFKFCLQIKVQKGTFMETTPATEKLYFIIYFLLYIFCSAKTYKNVQDHTEQFMQTE